MAEQIIVHCFFRKVTDCKKIRSQTEDFGIEGQTHLDVFRMAIVSSLVIQVGSHGCISYNSHMISNLDIQSRSVKHSQDDSRRTQFSVERFFLLGKVVTIVMTVLCLSVSMTRSDSR